ncbi:atp4 subunit B of the stator stalk of mitochondrial F1F0 ATP synthase [Nowakowskiella sp. JEL0078]|nr:atp4 subunit B of the stator stalk of mitochondrial F1F0 ATP synthase [Nowakowskiella sp. JEL0078]
MMSMILRTTLRNSYFAANTQRQLVFGALKQTRAAYSTERSEPSVVAESLINKFPGESLAAKSGNVLLFSSIAAYIISKEVYVVDMEFFEALCIFGAFSVWYTGGKDLAISYIRDRREKIRSVLTQAREDHKAVVQERITHISKLSDVVDVTKDLYGLSKAFPKLIQVLISYIYIIQGSCAT